jgi:hypothetical protein
VTVGQAPICGSGACENVWPVSVLVISIAVVVIAAVVGLIVLITSVWTSRRAKTSLMDLTKASWGSPCQNAKDIQRIGVLVVDAVSLTLVDNDETRHEWRLTEVAGVTGGRIDVSTLHGWQSKPAVIITLHDTSQVELLFPAHGGLTYPQERVDQAFAEISGRLQVGRSVEVDPPD